MKDFIKLISWPTFWQAAARLISGIASVFLTLILTRSSLGVEGFGDFTKILALVSVFYLPADFGLNATFIQLASKTGQARLPDGQVKKLFFNLFFIRLFWATFLFLISFLASFALYQIEAKTIFLASATILTTALTTTALAYFQLRLSYFWQFLASLASSFLALFLILLSLGQTLTLQVVFWAILAGQFVGVVINFSKIWQELKFLGEKIDWEQIKQYFQQSLALGLTLVFNLVYFKADIILLSLLSTSTSVGLYGLAVRIFEWAILPPVFLLNAAFPVLAKAAVSDPSKLQNLAKIIAKILFGLSLIVFLPLFFFPNFFVNLIAGEIFSQSSAAVKILSVGIPFFYLSGLLMWLLVIFEKRKELVGIYFAGLLANLVLNLIFIPKFDFLAAAAITVAAEGLILVASFSVIFLHFQKLK